jgi:hypothetical protein
MEQPLNLYHSSVWHRVLKETSAAIMASSSSSPVPSPSGSPTPEFIVPPSTDNDAAVLRNTIISFGGLFLIFLVLFCHLRRTHPKVYNLRNWVPDIKTPLAQETYGSISWMWKLLLLIPDSEMLEECGMDALCFTRVLEFGFKLSVVGMCVAIWLMPVYKTAPVTLETQDIQDPIVQLSVSHLSSGSNRFIATVLGCYCVFGYAMYNLLKEFEWFILFRHQYLAKKRARNYTVYVQCIPPEYRTKAKLLRFLQQSHDHDAILEVSIAVKVPTLKKKVAKRDAIVSKLEHAINVEHVTGVTPTERRRRTNASTSTTPPTAMGAMVLPPLLSGSEHVNLIDALFEDLRQANAAVTESIEAIEKVQKDQIVELAETTTTTSPTMTMSMTMMTTSAQSDKESSPLLLSPSFPIGEESSSQTPSLGPPVQPPRQSLLSSLIGSLYSNSNDNDTLTNHNDNRSDTLNTTPLYEEDIHVSDLSNNTSIDINNNNNNLMTKKRVSFLDDPVGPATASSTRSNNSNTKQESIRSTGGDSNSSTLVSSLLGRATQASTGLVGGATQASKTFVGGATLASKTLVGGATLASKTLVGGATQATAGVKTLAATAVNIMVGEGDGTPVGAAFVSFTSLRAAQTTLQMIQYPEPFSMEVMEAPDPDGTYKFTILALGLELLRSIGSSVIPISLPNTLLTQTCCCCSPFVPIKFFSIWNGVQMCFGKMLEKVTKIFRLASY